MTKAEERALEAYPYFPTEVNLFGHKTITADGNSHDRAIYIRGYEQAEKDLELTWEDMVIIHSICADVYDSHRYELDSKQIYEEVLRRFNKAKEEKQ